jgi:hypothetical protein
MDDLSREVITEIAILRNLIETSRGIEETARLSRLGGGEY